MKLTLYLLLLYTLFVQPAFAQFGMGGPPHPSAVLDLKSPTNDKGFYPPRLTTVQRKAITNAQPGMFVYDLDQNTFYLFDGANWLPLAFQNPASIMPTTRLASDGVAGDNFGFSVAISGDYALVGASGKTIGSNSFQGAAYVFVRSGSSWTQRAKLTASDGAADDRFGFSVAISGDYALVGAHDKTIGSNAGQGAAYVFVRSGNSWNEQQILTATDGAANDSFGVSVAISGDYALVGAHNKTIGSTRYQGAAYLFRRNGTTWPQLRAITDNSPANTLNGHSVAISNGSFIIGGYLFQNYLGKVSFGVADN